MEDFNAYILQNRRCPITGLSITPILPADGFYSAGYIIPDLNKDCLIQISSQVLTNPAILGFLQHMKKQFALNLMMNDATEIAITTENYLVFVTQLSNN